MIHDYHHHDHHHRDHHHHHHHRQYNPLYHHHYHHNAPHAQYRKVAEAELRLGEAIASRAGNLKAFEVRFCFHLVRIMVTFDQSSLLTITFDQFSFRFVISTCPSAQI